MWRSSGTAPDCDVTIAGCFSSRPARHIVGAMTTDFEVIALFTPADGQADALHAALAGLVAPSRAEPANRGYAVRRISATPPRYAVLERYRDRAGFEAHRVAPHLTAFRERFDELLAKLPEVLVLEPGEVR